MSAQTLEAQPSEILRRGREDPVWWFTNVLGAKPWPAQEKILESVRDNRITSVRSSHGVGKSWVAGRGSLWFCATHVPSIGITTAPGERQVKGVLWKEIRSAHSRARLPIGGEMLKLQINFDEDWFLWGFTAPEYDPDKFMGFHSDHILIVVDEACGVSQEIFDGGVAALMSNDNARLLMIGNPTNPTGEFADSFKREDVAKFKITAFDTPNFTHFGITEEDIASGEWRDKIGGQKLPMPGLVSPRWVRERFERWGPEDPRYRSRVLAEFPEDHEQTLFKMAWLDRVFGSRKMIKPGIKRFGVDPARYGMNETVIAYRNGNYAKIIGGRRGLDTLECAAWIKFEGIKYTVTEISIDPIGQGAGVLDQLLTWRRYGAIPFEVMEASGAEAPLETTQFVNKRAEMYWHLRGLCERDEIHLDDDPELRHQLLNLRFEYLGGRIKIESKDDMKKRGLDSPDRADALVYAFADGVQKPPVCIVY